jgi:hypothetical protein
MHETSVLWPRCSNRICRRTRACAGDVDDCGARCFPEGWAWVRGVVRSLHDGQPPRQATRAADRHVVEMEDNGDFGRTRPRTVKIHYPGMGDTIEMVIRE